MTDSDDAVSRRYRALAREEPPAAIDGAILAASRRAVGAPEAPRRGWAVPVSIAAVLVLGIGISLRMQRDDPGIETSTTASEYPVPQATEAPPSERERSPARKAVKPAQSPSEAASAASNAASPAPQPRPFGDLSRQDSRSEAASRVPPGSALPMQSQESATTPSLATATTRQPIVSPPPATPELRSKRIAPAADSAEPFAAQDPREAQLERIARLRADGRHDEADKALEAFRREHPQYRIPEALRERVKPR